jgi:protein-tyrosine phosphatase-like protein
MNEPIGTDGLVDSETALQREVDVLSQRFPQMERDELERYVRDTYAELERDAEVRAHLVAVTRARVTEKLRERGEPIHVRSEEDQPDNVKSQ